MIRSVLFICSIRKIFSDHKNKGFENFFWAKISENSTQNLKKQIKNKTDLNFLKAVGKVNLS